MADRCVPIFLIAGGHRMRVEKGPNPLLQAVFRRTGIRRPTVAYVGAASGDDATFRLSNVTRLQEAGAGKVNLAPLCGRSGNAERAKAVLDASDMVFLSGGDVEEGIWVLKEKGMIDFLGRLYRGGTPFFGISAGSIMLARQWIRWRDPDDDRTSELFNCLGFASILCDTHGEDDGWQELQALLALSPVDAIGYGIASGTALVVEPSGIVCVLGGEVPRFQKQAAAVVRVESLLPSGSF